MHAKPLAGAFLVNRAPSELVVGADSLSWWPSDKKQQETQHESNILNTKQKIEFANVVAIKRISAKQLKGDRKFIKNEPTTIHGGDTNGQTDGGPSLDRHTDKIRLDSQEVDQQQESQLAAKRRLLYKIKIYYAQRTESKPTGRLLKLKKLSITKLGGGASEPSRRVEGEKLVALVATTTTNSSSHGNLESSESHGGGGATQGPKLAPAGQSSCQLARDQLAVRRADLHLAPSLQDSAPPSCYASEGSNGHLSSLSGSSSSSSSPTQNLAADDVPLASLGLSDSGCSGKSNGNGDRNHKPSQLEPSDRQQPQQQQQCLLVELCERLEQRLRAKQCRRPKRLLIFVNPFGGKGKALHSYKSQVRRLLELAGIESKLIVTQHANHARNTIEDRLFDVEYFNGIICIGGDGMFSELMNGLLFRYNRQEILSVELGSLDRRLGRMDVSTDYDIVHQYDDDVDGDLDGEEESLEDNGSGRQTKWANYNSNTKMASKHSNATTPMESDLDTDCCRQGVGGGATPASTTITITKTNTNNDCKHINHNIGLKKQLLVKLRSTLGGIGRRFQSPPIPIGVIGAGSTDCNSFGLIGTNDVITATLNIILGNQIHVDVCSIHSVQDDRVLRFVSTFIAYGYFGDVIRESERFRWLGPSRYDLTGLNTLLRNRTYKGLVRILRSSRDGTPHDVGRCHVNCSLCYDSSHQLADRPSRRSRYAATMGAALGQGGASDDGDEQNDDHFEFIEKCGPFIGVNAAVTACRCPQTRKGFSPGNHLANGCADLILVRPCTRMQYVNYLLRTGYTKKSAFDLKFVDAFRCRQFEFLAQDDECDDNPVSKLSQGSDSSSSQQSSNSNSLDTNKSTTTTTTTTTTSTTTSIQDQLGACNGGSSWNADGEILKEKSIRVKVNNRLLRVFGTGEPQPI